MYNYTQLYIAIHAKGQIAHCCCCTEQNPLVDDGRQGESFFVRRSGVERDRGNEGKQIQQTQGPSKPENSIQMDKQKTDKGLEEQN